MKVSPSPRKPPCVSNLVSGVPRLMSMPRCAITSSGVGSGESPGSIKNENTVRKIIHEMASNMKHACTTSAILAIFFAIRRRTSSGRRGRLEAHTSGFDSLFIFRPPRMKIPVCGVGTLPGFAQRTSSFGTPEGAALQCGRRKGISTSIIPQNPRFGKTFG